MWRIRRAHDRRIHTPSDGTPAELTTTSWYHPGGASEADAGSSIDLEVLLIAGSDGDKISATVVDHGRDQKIVVFKKKRRKQYKRTRGHRQNYTTLKIDSIG